MGPSLTTVAVVTALVAVTMAGAVAYLRRVRVQRAPVGVYTLRDVVVMSVVLVVLPPLYLHLPTAAVAAVLGLVAGFVAHFTLQPLLGRAAVPLVAAVLAADLALAQLHDADGHHPAFLVVNDLLLVLLVVGVVNLYVQSGMRARQVAAFAGGLVVYDYLATVAFPVMVEFFTRVASMPFTPVLGWGSGDDALGVGLGDVLVASLWVAAVEKGFGRRAALVAALLGAGAALGIALAFWSGLLDEVVPVMVVLGPLVLVQYAVLRRRPERTTAAYLGTGGRGSAPSRAVPPVPEAALAVAMGLVPATPDATGATGGTGGRYLAVVGTEVVGEGSTTGAARMAARRARPGAVPVLVWTDAPY